MAIKFDQSGSYEALEGDHATPTTSVLLSCWIYHDSTQNAADGNARMANVCNSGFSEYVSMSWDNVPTKRGRCGMDSSVTGSYTQNAPSPPTEDIYSHRLLYVDDTNMGQWLGGTNEGWAAHGEDFPLLIDKFSLGSRYNSDTQRVDCRIERFYVWNDIPDQTQTVLDKMALHLSLGGNPRLWWPDKIKTVVPGTYDKGELGGTSVTEQGTPELLAVATHQQGAW